MAEGTRTSAEIDRISAEYARRGVSPSEDLAADPARLLNLQDLEWHLVRALSRCGAPLGGARVLDVGSGSGYLLHRLVELGARDGTGVDLMADRVEIGRARYPNLRLMQGEATRLPFESGSFDVVTQFTCLSSVLDPDVRAAIASEMWRVCRSGGALVSYDLRPAAPPIRAVGSLVRGRDSGHWTPVTTIGAGELRRLFPHAPATVCSMTLNAALPVALRRFRPLALALGAIPPLRSHFLAVLRKP